jgi:hypothetical protein
MTRYRRIAQAAAITVIGSVMAVTGSAAANADPDTDFAAQLHSYGVYGPRDYNAWIGKIACQRIDNDVDRDAYQSATFVTNNLDRHNSTEQNWQFLAAAIDSYCPERRVVLEKTAAQR